MTGLAVKRGFRPLPGKRYPSPCNSIATRPKEDEMPGHIRRRGKDTWEVAIRLGRDPSTGQYRRKFIAVKGTKSDARKVLTEALHEHDTGIDVDPGKLTVAEYLRRWLRDYAAHNVAPSTLARYDGIVERHLIPQLGGLGLRDLRPAHIQAAYGRALTAGGRVDGRPGPLSARTVIQHHRVLREALSHAVQWQLMARDPTTGVRPPQPERREMRVLSPDEARHLLEVANKTRIGALIYVAVATGARLGELLGLRWNDLDLDGGTMRITRTAQTIPGQGTVFSAPKTRRSVRPIALSPDTVNVIKEHRRMQLQQRIALGPAYVDEELVFASATGNPLGRSNVRTSFLRLTRKAGIDGVRFHDLRHTAATLMLAAGVHPKIVSERLGHATISITLDTYSHVLPGMQREAANLLDVVLRTK
jgi:integrase